MPDPAAKAKADPRAGRLWFLATLPPPVNGQSNCNAAMWALLSKQAHPLKRPLGVSSIGKVLRALANCWAILRHAKAGETLYVSIPGQNGAWLLVPAIMAARLRGMAIWFHHHSFRPINRGPAAAMRTLVAQAGSRQDHILLSETMRDRFAAMYLAHGGNAHALSNIVLFPPVIRCDQASRPERPPTLGHMSVLTRDKGVLYLIDLFDELSARIPGIRLVIAGPSSDPDVLAAIRAASVRHPDTFSYRGAVGGAERERFYGDVDLFVLPTTLVDEAEPLVMIEAYSRGVDVLATATGCIPDRIRDPRLIMSLDRVDDAERIGSTLCATGGDWSRRADACRAHVTRLFAVANQQSAQVMRRLCDTASPLTKGSANDMAATKADLP